MASPERGEGAEVTGEEEQRGSPRGTQSLRVARYRVRREKRTPPGRTASAEEEERGAAEAAAAFLGADDRKAALALLAVNDEQARRADHVRRLTASCPVGCAAVWRARKIEPKLIGKRLEDFVLEGRIIKVVRKAQEARLLACRAGRAVGSRECASCFAPYGDGCAWLACGQCRKVYHLECVAEGKRPRPLDPFVCPACA